MNPCLFLMVTPYEDTMWGKSFGKTIQMHQMFPHVQTLFYNLLKDENVVIKLVNS